MSHLCMAVMHLPTNFCANNSIQFVVIHIFRNPRWPPPPSWIFSLCEFGHSGVLFCTKFGSNICYSHWDRRTYASDLHLMTSRELTSGFDFLVTWSSPRRRDASFHIIWCKISLSSPKLLRCFRNSRWRPPPSWIFNLCEFGHSSVLAVWYLCSVANLVQISVIITEIDAFILQTFIW